MAESSTGLAELIAALPPPLQGIFALGVGVGITYLLWRRFQKSFKGETTEGRGEFFFTSPTAIADMQPIRDLTAAVLALVQQEIKTESAILTAAGSLTGTTAAANEFLALLKQDREKKETRDELELLLKDLRLAELERQVGKRRISRARTPSKARPASNPTD